jgi:hypothetical protein
VITLSFLHTPPFPSLDGTYPLIFPNLLLSLSRHCTQNVRAKTINKISCYDIVAYLACELAATNMAQTQNKSQPRATGRRCDAVVGPFRVTQTSKRASVRGERSESPICTCSPVRGNPGSCLARGIISRFRTLAFRSRRRRSQSEPI